MLFLDFVSNKVILAALTAWLATQVLKFFVNWITEGKPDFRRLFGDGGMPSGHSATVVSVAVMVGYTHGFGSALFGLAFIIAIIVMHDARGVRRETGKQARVLLEIVSMLNDVLSERDRIVRRQKLKTMVGHTPMQVVCGALFGVAVSALFIWALGIPYMVYA